MNKDFGDKTKLIREASNQEEGIKLREIWENLGELKDAPPFTLSIENLTSDDPELKDVIDQRFHLTLTMNSTVYGDNSIFLNIKLEDETISEARTVVSSTFLTI